MQNNVLDAVAVKKSHPGLAVRYQKDEPVFISASPVINDILSRIDSVAKSHAPVFIAGESGTGKEVIARLLHQKSGRAGRPCITVNCAALPKDVIDNELFGHEREAFTGAVSMKAGCFELADGGTLFLDEIAEMHPQLQSKLLRAIETKSFRRLGGREEITVDARVIAATNKDLAAALKIGELREDLYYRLSVVEIVIPPLRERREDIPLLIQYYMTVFSDKYGRPQKSISDECMQKLVDFNWPGNVRELKNVIESLLLLRPEEVIEPSMLPERISKHNPTRPHIVVPVGSSLKAAERMLIEQTLASTGHNKSRAAKILGVSRKSLYEKLVLYRK